MDLSRQERFLESKNCFNSSIYSKHIVLVGCGGTGSPLGELLARGGFTQITLIDFDVIEKSNIQRQLFLPKHIGTFKAEKLKKRMLTINPKIICKSIVDQLQEENIHQYLNTCDIILDATDNFKVRFLIDSYAKNNDIPWIYLGANKGEVLCGIMDGKKSNFDTIISKNAKDEGCEFGVLASTTFIGASLSYNQLLKYFSIENYTPKLLKFNIWNGSYFEVDL